MKFPAMPANVLKSKKSSPYHMLNLNFLLDYLNNHLHDVKNSDVVDPEHNNVKCGNKYSQFA
jgi:hypothetical protein